MTIKTRSEYIFEEFCKKNNLQWEKIAERDEPTPDYKVFLNAETVIFEIKQIDKDDGFTETGSSRTVGDHVREKINEARKQLKFASRDSFPAILLIYNNLDPMQMFATEQHDFISAMYGELTVRIDLEENMIKDSYQGRNQALRHNKNTSFSAVGKLYQADAGPKVLIYENIFSENKLDYSSLPKCIEAMRIELV